MHWDRSRASTLKHGGPDAGEQTWCLDHVKLGRSQSGLGRFDSECLQYAATNQPISSSTRLEAIASRLEAIAPR